MSTERSGLAAINPHIYLTVNTFFFFFEVVVPVNLVMEDVVLSDDDGKQLSVRRSDLALGENPGVQELGHPVSSLSSAGLHNGEAALCFWEGDNLKLLLSLTWMQVKMHVNHETQIQELPVLNFRVFRLGFCALWIVANQLHIQISSKFIAALVCSPFICSSDFKIKLSKITGHKIRDTLFIYRSSQSIIGKLS